MAETVIGVTRLKVLNATSNELQVYITLGAVDCCLQKVSEIPFVTHVINDLQGSFTLPAWGGVDYAPPSGTGISGNLCFGSPPINCPTPQFPSGVNLAEFILNNGFEGSHAQETIDISCVAGANALISYSLSGGGKWNAGPTQPAVASFANKSIGENTGLVGVFPYGCDNCTSSDNPPRCDTPPVGAPTPWHLRPKRSAMCNVTQRKPAEQ